MPSNLRTYSFGSGNVKRGNAIIIKDTEQLPPGVDTSSSITPEGGIIDGILVFDSNANIVKPLDQTNFSTETLPDTVNLEGQSALATNTGQGSSPNTEASTPPTPPSTRPYVWKYQ